MEGKDGRQKERMCKMIPPFKIKIRDMLSIETGGMQRLPWIRRVLTYSHVNNEIKLQ